MKDLLEQLTIIAMQAAEWEAAIKEEVREISRIKEDAPYEKV